MSARWRFNEVRPGDRAREPQIEKFFNDQKDRASPIIREGIQNSLDAAKDNQAVVRVRLTLGEWTAAEVPARWAAYAATLAPHVAAVAERLPDAPAGGDPFRFLVFEDFETTGLGGDPAEWRVPKQKNPFFDFFRGEGVSHKSDDDRGRHGVGKYVFVGASRIRTIFGLTRRASDGQELLMGTAVLRMHRFGDTHYMPDGWYGVADAETPENVLPLADAEVIAKFKADFGVSRTTEPGLSVVIPWLDNEITPGPLVQAVIEGYFLPLVRGDLVVEVFDGPALVARIAQDTISDVVAGQGAEYAAKLAVRLELAAAAATSAAPVVLAPPPADKAPAWDAACFPPPILATLREQLATGGIVHMECPTRVQLKKPPQELVQAAQLNIDASRY